MNKETNIIIMVFLVLFLVILILTLISLLTKAAKTIKTTIEMNDFYFNHIEKEKGLYYLNRFEHLNKDTLIGKFLDKDGNSKSILVTYREVEDFYKSNKVK